MAGTRSQSKQPEHSIQVGGDPSGSSTASTSTASGRAFQDPTSMTADQMSLLEHQIRAEELLARQQQILALRAENQAIQQRADAILAATDASLRGTGDPSLRRTGDDMDDEDPRKFDDAIHSCAGHFQGRVPLKFIQQIRVNAFDPRNLVFLRRSDATVKTSDVLVSNTGKLIRQTTTPSSKHFKSFAEFLECFTHYIAIFATFFASMPEVVVAMVMWLNTLIRWETIYRWNSVIDWALSRLLLILHNPVDLEKWKDFSSKSEWLNETSLRAPQGGAALNRTSLGAGDKRKATGTCNNWNSDRGCSQTPCKWTHACSKCEGSHTAVSCPKGKRTSTK